MKDKGWISLKKSLKDSLKKAFKETTMRNLPILELQIKKRNPKLKSVWKTEQDIPFRKLCSLVKGQFKKLKSMVNQIQRVRSHVNVMCQFYIRETVVALTWHSADAVMTIWWCMHAWLLTWKGWRNRMTSASFLAHGECEEPTRHLDSVVSTWERLGPRINTRFLRFCKSAANEANMAARVTRGWSRCEEFEVVRGEVGDTVAKRAAFDGGQTSGFSYGMPEEHNCVIGFIRQRLNLHKYKIGQA